MKIEDVIYNNVTIPDKLADVSFSLANFSMEMGILLEKGEI